jgi:hypothetical protein
MARVSSGVVGKTVIRLTLDERASLSSHPADDYTHGRCTLLEWSGQCLLVELHELWGVRVADIVPIGFDWYGLTEWPR